MFAFRRTLMDETIMAKGAILSRSVAEGGKPILYAERSDPLDEFDSGWQFLSNEEESLTAEEVRIWTIGEVLEHEPTLGKFVHMREGTKFFRVTKSSQWTELQ
jgi:hypothetical protein